MARPLRIEFEGAWYHIMNRGASGKPIFLAPEQRQYFLSLLADTTERFNAEWHAYCLMGNHYHLLLRTPDGNLQRIMRHIGGLYTQHFNRAQGRDGALFRGRYKAILIDAESYWLRLSRYIHRNPLEAGLVDKLERYSWSSYPAYIGKAERPDWLAYRYILNAVSPRQAEADYRSYVEAGTDAEIEAFYATKRQSPILGDDDFKHTLEVYGSGVDLPELKQARVPLTAEQIVKATARHFCVREQTIWVPTRGRQAHNPARATAMFLCQEAGDIRLADIASRFGLKHYASAGSSIRQFRKRLDHEPELQKSLDTIKLDLTP